MKHRVAQRYKNTETRLICVWSFYVCVCESVFMEFVCACLHVCALSYQCACLHVCVHTHMHVIVCV